MPTPLRAHTNRNNLFASGVGGSASGVDACAFVNGYFFPTDKYNLYKVLVGKTLMYKVCFFSIHSPIYYSSNCRVLSYALEYCTTGACHYIDLLISFRSLFKQFHLILLYSIVTNTYNIFYIPTCAIQIE